MTRLQTIQQLPTSASPDTPMQRPLPSYLAANLPSAAGMPNRLVIVLDDPQGLATSTLDDDGVRWYWRAEVDASDLGEGNASARP